MERSIKNLAKDVILGVQTIGLGRQEERKGANELLSKILEKEVKITHDENGKPVIQDYNISISHSKDYLAILLSKALRVGIDIEYWSERIQKIAKRFLHKDENYTTTEDLLITWCAKEAVYKLFSEEHLGYQDMKVDIERQEVTNLKNNISVKINITFHKDYIMVTTWLP